MKQLYLKMLAAIVFAVAGSSVNAQGVEDWKTIWSADFDSETLPEELTFTLQNNQVTAQRNEKGQLILASEKEATGQRTASLNFAGDVFQVDEHTPWKLEFDWGCSTGNNGNEAATSTMAFTTAAGDTIFTMTWGVDEEKQPTNVTVRYNHDQSQLTTAIPTDGVKRGTDAKEINSMVHFVLTADPATGIYITITNGEKTITDRKLIFKQFATPKALGGTLGRTLTYMALDNMTFAVPLEDDAITTNLKLLFNGQTSGNLKYRLGEGEVAADTLLTGQYWSPASNSGAAGVWNTLPSTWSDSYLNMANGNITAELLKWDEIGSQDKVTIQFDLALGWSTRASDRSFTIQALNANGDDIFKEVFNVREAKYRSSTLGIPADGSAALPVEGAEPEGYGVLYYSTGSSIWDFRTHFEIVLDYANGTITASADNSGWQDYCNPASLKWSNTIQMNDAQSIPLKSIFFESGDMGRTSNANKLGNVIVKTVKGDYTNVRTITYQYVNQNGDDIADIIMAAPGANAKTKDYPALNTKYTPSYPATFTDADFVKDYTYVSGGEAFTVTDDKTITLVYAVEEHPTTNVKVKYTVDGETVKTETVASNFPVGKTATYWVNRYTLIDGTLYEAQKLSDYYQRQQVAEAGKTYTEKLTKTDITNVAFLAEAEDIEGVTSGANVATRASGGLVAHTQTTQKVKVPTADGGEKDSTIYVTNMVKATTLAAGKYKIYLMGHNGNNATRVGAFAVNGDSIGFQLGNDTVPTFRLYSDTNQSRESVEFEVNKASTLTFGVEGSSASGIDYFYIVKTGEVADYATVSETGYTTFSSTHAVNLADLPEGAKAYYLTEEDFVDAVMTLREIDGDAIIPAGTGIILEGAPGAELILPWAADSLATELEGNLLVAALEQIDLEPAEDTYVMKGDNGWAEFRRVTETTSIKAGKAYLKIPVLSDALADVETFFVFSGDGDPTAIKGVDSAEPQTTGVYYNLSGQRVKNPTKGIYIVDGKKVYVK